MRWLFLLITLTAISACSAPPEEERMASASDTLVLSSEQQALLTLDHVRLTPSSADYPVPVSGEIVPTQEAESVVSTPIAGRITRVLVRPGQTVAAGQTVALLESLELATLVGDFLTAASERTLRERQAARSADLERDGIQPTAQREEAEAASQQAEARLRALSLRLIALGLSPDSLLSRPPNRASLPLRTSQRGMVTDVHLHVGEAVDAHAAAVHLLAEGQLELRLDLPLAIVSSVQIGTEVELGAQRVRISRLGHALDGTTQSIPAFAALPGGMYRAGQRVPATLLITPSQPRLLLPSSAVFFEGDLPAVFLRVAPGAYVHHLVQLGPAEGDFFPVLSGLTSNEDILTTSVFDVKALFRSR